MGIYFGVNCAFKFLLRGKWCSDNVMRSFSGVIVQMETMVTWCWWGKTGSMAVFLTCQKKNPNSLLFLFLWILFVFLFFKRGIVIYKGCENEGRVTCWGKGFVIWVKAKQYIVSKEKAIYRQTVCTRYLNATCKQKSFLNMFPWSHTNLNLTACLCFRRAACLFLMKGISFIHGFTVVG